MSVSEIKKKHICHLLIFKKKMRFTPDKNTNLKKYAVCNIGSNFILLIIHSLLVFYFNGS